MQKAAKIVRVLTIAPIMALALLLALYFRQPFPFATGQLVAAILFLVVLPVLGYPLQKVIPSFKASGRDGQRRLAFIMALLGYVGGIVFCLVTRASVELSTVFWTYFVSGLVLTFFNKVIKHKASGHACGIAGPIAIAVYFLGPAALLVGAVLFAAMCWASLSMKRHTLSELLLGAAVSVGSLLLVVGAVRLFHLV